MTPAEIAKLLLDEIEDTKKDIPEGEYREGYLMGFYDAIETINNLNNLI